ncbi:MAG: hypothetical protein AAFN27_00280 [Pseudomonadota bacterium]
MISVDRIGSGPIIHQDLHPSLGDNINGPSLVRVPDGLAGALGRYYLYFSHHKGQHIRLAVADRIEGPWQIHSPGVMPLRETPFTLTVPNAPQPNWAISQGTDGLYPHLASPDVRIRHDGAFEMYVHGLDASGEQVTWRAQSANGLSWRFTGKPIVDSYLRLFQSGGTTYAMARCSRIWRLDQAGWQRGGVAISDTVRHVAVLIRRDQLHVLFTRIGDAPERILHTSISLNGAWRRWQAASDPEHVLSPDLPWEGSNEPVSPSKVGAVSFSNALRDPCLFEDQGTVWMVYAGGGESALGLARVTGL